MGKENSNKIRSCTIRIQFERVEIIQKMYSALNNFYFEIDHQINYPFVNHVKIYSFENYN